MYNTYKLLVTISSLVFVYNIVMLPMMDKLKKTHLYNEINEKIGFLIDFYNFLCENNPLLLSYYYEDVEDDDEDRKCESNVESVPQQILVKYEDKYLTKFKQFPNEFNFDELELEQERIEYENIKINFEKERLDNINKIQEELFKINEIEEKGGIVKASTSDFDDKNSSTEFAKNINDLGIDKLLKYYDMEFDYEEDPNDICFENLYACLVSDKEKFEKKLQEIEKMVLTDEESRLKARQVIIKNKLDKFMNNYILEHTPLGNIYMRYNNDKGSFEYFSNNSIPYRYLEPVGRKYVMTYWCKQIFVDIEEELKKAEIKYDENKKKKDEDEKRRQEEIKNNPKNVIARLKSYNKETKSQVTMKQPMKNRSANNVLPPQIQANLPNVNNNLEKQLLKENANRYTWEGRLTGFCPLKKIDKKILDKKLNMSYAEFKIMQQNITK
jgi:hypothetical protein